ncbi:MAG: hypothetical protein JO002_11850, partial [Burkholderiaceae bacterium]|nr:hypothetical protein [Burkholderiaceae bacterium]
CESTALAWEARAAQGGLESARLALAEQAWAQGDHAAYLAWALPVARATRGNLVGKRSNAISPEQVEALAKCAKILAAQPDSSERDIRNFWECAASHGNAQAQLDFGQWLACTPGDDEPAARVPSPSDLDMSAQLLVMAGRQGKVEAWYALSQLYGSAHHPRPSNALQRHYLKKAAERGHRQAQYECGLHAWNNGEARASGVVRAIYWLELANDKGCAASRELLQQIRQIETELLCNARIASSASMNALFTA